MEARPRSQHAAVRGPRAYGGPFARRVYMWRRGHPVEDRHRPTRYHVARSPLNLAAWALGRAASVFR